MTAIRGRWGARGVALLAAAAVAAAAALAGCTTPSASNDSARERDFAPSARTAARSTRNVVIFVADGLRAGSVNETDTPTLFSIRRDGVYFANSHSLYPTLTTPNASAIATGHYLGDTGDFANNPYLGFRVFDRGNFGARRGGPMPFLESNEVLGDVNEHFERRNFLNEETLLAVARARAFDTAAIGKHGPTAIQDVTQVTPVGGRFAEPRTVIVDDTTGSESGVPLAPHVRDALAAAGLPLAAPRRVQPSGTATRPGTLSANVEQQQWFADVATKAVLPMFAASGTPFVMVYWSRDPDGTQHSHGDSLNTLVPGINGPTSRAAVANADRNLAQILAFIRSDPRLRDTTDVLVTADHGFATVSRHDVDARGTPSASYSAGFTYLGRDGEPNVVPGFLPPGFLAIDLAHFLGLPLYDPDTLVTVDGAERYALVNPAEPASATTRQRPAQGGGLIGGSGAADEHASAEVIVAAAGGSDLIYLPRRDAALARRIVAFLARQDYVGGLFADPAFGAIPGTLPTSAVALDGAALTPRPQIVVAFKTFASDPSNPTMTAVQIADTGLQQGQGMHGGFGRGSTRNNMAATGPDFKKGFVDRAPVSNADVVPTAARILGIELPSVGALRGRVLAEALAGGPDAVRSRALALASAPAEDGRSTLLHYQEADGRRYFDFACFVEVRGPVRSEDAPALCGEEPPIDAR